MDRHVRRFDSINDNDLMLCPLDGVAYQIDDERVTYGRSYFEKYLRYEGQEIARKLNRERVALVRRFYSGPLLDIGIGSGEFIKNRPETFGYDINPEAVNWLKEGNLYRDDFESFRAFTFWDVLEHVCDPQAYLDRITGYVFASLPVFLGLKRIRNSRHYRPGEHLYYWTETGFIRWMSLYGFNLIDVSDGEIVAGREDILSFVFLKC